MDDDLTFLEISQKLPEAWCLTNIIIRRTGFY